MRIKRLAVAAAMSMGLIGVAASPALAYDGAPPVVNFGPTTFVTGSTLSNNTSSPYVQVTAHWSSYDPSGVCSEQGWLYDTYYGNYTYEPSIGVGTTSFTFSQQVGSSRYEVYLQEYDCASPQNFGEYYGGSSYPQLVQSNAATQIGPHWTTSNCNCWSQGVTEHTTIRGAFINEQFYGSSVGIVGDIAVGRGVVNVFIDGVKVGSFNEACTAPTCTSKTNMGINFQATVANTGNHVVQVVNAIGGKRVDIDAFVTM